MLQGLVPLYRIKPQRRKSSVLCKCHKKGVYNMQQATSLYLQRPELCIPPPLPLLVTKNMDGGSQLSEIRWWQNDSLFW